MKKLTIILIAIAIVSCSNTLKKTVFEPLTLEELKSEIKKDSLFELTYKEIQYVRDSVLKTEIDKVKWADLTYEWRKRCH